MPSLFSIDFSSSPSSLGMLLCVFFVFCVFDHAHQRDDELISLMVEFCGKFCKDYVASQVLPPVDFFLQEPMYGELLERTRKAAKSAERVVEIYEDDVQRNSIHADFFV